MANKEGSRQDFKSIENEPQGIPSLFLCEKVPLVPTQCHHTKAGRHTAPWWLCKVSANKTYRFVYRPSFAPKKWGLRKSVEAFGRIDIRRWRHPRMEWSHDLRASSAEPQEKIPRQPATSVRLETHHAYPTVPLLLSQQGKN